MRRGYEFAIECVFSVSEVDEDEQVGLRLLVNNHLSTATTRTSEHAVCDW